MSLGFNQNISDLESAKSESSVDMSSIASIIDAHATVSPSLSIPEDDASSSVQQSRKFYFQEEMVVIHVRYQ